MTLLNSNNPIPDDAPNKNPKPKVEEQEEKPSGNPSRPKQLPKSVIHKGMSSHSPKAGDPKRTSVFGRKSAKQQPAESQPVASPVEKKPNAFPRPKPQSGSASAVSTPVEPIPQTPAPAENIRSEPAPQAVSRPAPSTDGDQKVQSRNGKGINPGLRLRALEAAGRNAPASQPPVVETAPVQPKARPSGKRTGGFDWDDFLKPRKPRVKESLKAAWHVYRVIAAIINVVLVILVLVLALCIRYLYTTLNGVLGGLYDNFVRMDSSVISTTIPVNQAPIPLDFILPVVQDETNVTLTQPVTITGARVTINSGAITINNAPATVVLPAGTTLPVSLHMDVPVQTTLYVDLQVPVNIKLFESNPENDGVMGLHDAFYGLQNTLGPFYCIFNRDAQDASGAVCQQGVYIPKKIYP